MEPERVVIVGAGQTGRGMFGALFYKEGCYELTFADTDAALVRGLREQGHYTVEEKDLLTGSVEHVRVDGFSCVDVADRDVYLDALARATYIAVAVFPKSFDDVARDLADMVRVRKARGMEDVVAVILGGNFVGLHDYFQRAIEGRLNEEERAYARTYVALATSKANRKVVHAGAGAERFALTGDNKSVLSVENCLPFEAGHRLPSFFHINPDVELSMIEKIWSENLIHCSLGFMGACAGYATVNEAIEDTRIGALALYAWFEGRRALEAAYGIPVPDEVAIKTMMEKFDTPYFHDRITRIVRQPIRKLKKGDRFLGPALLCIEQGITPYFILRAAAYGFCYEDDTEPQSVEIARLVRELGIDEAVRAVTELDPCEPRERLALEMLADAVREVSCPRRLPEVFSRVLG